MPSKKNKRNAKKREKRLADEKKHADAEETWKRESAATSATSSSDSSADKFEANSSIFAPRGGDTTLSTEMVGDGNEMLSNPNWLRDFAARKQAETDAQLASIYGDDDDGTTLIPAARSTPAEDLPEQLRPGKRFDYSDGFSGLTQLVPFFIEGKDSLRFAPDYKKLRLLTAAQCRRKLGPLIYHTLGDALGVNVKQGHFPGAGPGDVFRHIVAIHVNTEVPVYELQQHIHRRSMIMCQQPFMDQLIADDPVQEAVGVCTGVRPNKRLHQTGEQCVVMVQVWLNGVDMYRAIPGKPPSPANPKLLQEMARRRGELPTGPARLSAEQIAEGEQIDKEFATMSFGNLAKQMKSGQGAGGGKKRRDKKGGGGAGAGAGGGAGPHGWDGVD